MLHVACTHSPALSSKLSVHAANSADGQKECSWLLTDLPDVGTTKNKICFHPSCFPDFVKGKIQNPRRMPFPDLAPSFVL